MASIALSGVSKVLPDGTAAVDGLDLDITDGGFTVLVGPSGSGKSTALRMVAGLQDTTTGTIRIADRVVNDVAPKDPDIAMVFQRYALYPHMSVHDNLGFSLKLRSVEQSRVRARVAAVARRLGSGSSSPGDGGIQAMLGSERLAIPQAILDQRPSLGDWIGEEVVIGIRPERCTWPRAPSPPAMRSSSTSRRGARLRLAHTPAHRRAARDGLGRIRRRARGRTGGTLHRPPAARPARRRRRPPADRRRRGAAQVFDPHTGLALR
jgi:ABC-type uncharacterized transport system YnjBCD ATPase subunit